MSGRAFTLSGARPATVCQAGNCLIVVLQVAVGRARRVHPLMWPIAAVFAVYFAIEPLRHLFGIT